jgi:ribose transport system substrate-binding protein
MSLSHRGLFLTAAACALALLPSCNRDSGGGKIKVAVVTNNPEDFWNICENGAKAAADKHGVELVFKRPEKGDAAIQRDIINDLVNQGVKGIAVSVINPEEQTQDLKNVSEKTHLLTMDNDAANSGRLCYVGTDNYEAGKAVGKLVKEVLPNGGKVAIFVGQITPINARQRFQGVVEELAGKKDADPKQPPGKYEIYKGEAITDGASRPTAGQNAGDALEQLKAEPNVCLVGLWAYNAPACLEAARSKGLSRKVKIVSFDEYPDTLAGIESGEIHATVVQDPYNFGYKSVEILAEIAKTGDKSKAEAIKGAVPHRIVAKATGADRMSVAEFNADMNKKLGK